MAVRQYIGARYVPRFVGTYDPTQIYEALDVVDNGSGTSYIARKTVPAGTALTDTEFWFIYGSSSGAIIALQNQVNNIENTEIPALETKIEAIEPILTVTDVPSMIAADLAANDIVHVYGYNTPGDRGAADYIISATSNDYSIALDNGLYANIISTGGITPQMFGVISDDPSSITQPKWDKYIKYVNTTDKCYFVLPTGTYNVRKPMIIAKSMIGEDNRPTIFADYDFTDNFDDTKVTTHGTTYAINGLMAIDNVKSYLTIEGFTLDCNNHCDYGLYIPELNKSIFNNIRITGANLDGLVLVRVWMSKFNVINVMRCNRHQFNIGYPTTGIMINGGIITSCQFNNLYAQGFGSDVTPAGLGLAYALANVYYSQFNVLACDGYIKASGHIYTLVNVNGTSFNNIAFEACGSNNCECIRINAGEGITFRGVTLLGCDFLTLFLLTSGDSEVDIYNITMQNSTSCVRYIDIAATANGVYNFFLGRNIVGTLRNSSSGATYFLNTATGLTKCINGVVHNLIS